LQGAAVNVVTNLAASATAGQVEYKIAVSTGLGNTANTLGLVFLTIHGLKGDTEEFALNDAAGGTPAPLAKGTTYEITKMLPDVGILQKIRIRNPSTTDDWECATISVAKDSATTNFKVNKVVLSPTQGTRWAYAEVEYMLNVATGVGKQAGTAEPQYITIYGTDGSTGELRLKDKFDAETMVSVTLNARDVGKPKYIMLRNPGSDDWLCASIRVMNSHGSFTFSANKWVATPKHPIASIPVDKVYTVWVKTGPSMDDATEGTILIQIFGVAGATTKHQLSQGFRRGTQVSISVSAKDVGAVTKIKLFTDSKDGWHCTSVDIGETEQNRVHFDVDKWLISPYSKSISLGADIPYKVLIKTSNETGADSTGAFAVNIYGTLGVTRTLPMVRKMGFDSEAPANFTLMAKDVGEITKMRLSTMQTDGWKCEDVTITHRGKSFPFSVDKWVEFPLAATVDTSVDIKYTFFIGTGVEEGADTAAMIWITMYGTQGQSRTLPLKTGFKKGSMETVSFQTRDIGRLTGVKLQNKAADNWYCNGITVNYGASSVPLRVAKWVTPTADAMVNRDGN